MDERQIRLIIDSRAENLGLLGPAVNRLCREASLGETEALQVELCVVEAASNAIRHAYEGRPGRQVEVSFRLLPARLVIEVRDTGIPMPPEVFEARCKAGGAALAEGSDREKAPEERGRGLAIIGRIMDEVAYERDGEGNRLVMVKRLPARGKPAGP